MELLDLTCKYINQRSFSGKAKVLIDGESIKLFSYDSLVLIYNLLNKEFEDVEYFPHSQTTTKHIKEFKQQIINGDLMHD